MVLPRVAKVRLCLTECGKTHGGPIGVRVTHRPPYDGSANVSGDSKNRAAWRSQLRNRDFAVNFIISRVTKTVDELHSEALAELVLGPMRPRGAGVGAFDEFKLRLGH